jgi:hypothetical protein
VTLKKLIILALSAIVVLAGLYFVNEYFRKPADITDQQESLTVSAEKLVQQFELNEASANKQYLGKIILVNGMVSEISSLQDSALNIVLSNGLHNISCQMDKCHQQRIRQIQVGDQVAIKGICSGFLMDVQLNRCVLIKNQ